MRQLGAVWTDHATEANVLVVKGIMRTEKFLLGKLCYEIVGFAVAERVLIIIRFR